MSKITFIGGDFIENIGGEHTVFVKKTHQVSSNGSINISADKGLFHGEPKDAPDKKAENEDFDITFALDKDTKTVVPLGILDFQNKYENAYFQFKYSLLKADIDSLNFKIKTEEGKTIYQMEYSKPVIIQTHKKSSLFEQVEKKVSILDVTQKQKTWDYKPLFESYNLPATDYTKKGDYIIFWDGFDNNKVYDSSLFNNKRLSATITATKGSKSEKIEVYFETKYSQVNWVDVKIDLNTKRIDTTLRVNLKDGGAEGLKCNTFEEQDTTISGEKNPFKGIKTTICNWDKISKEALAFYKKTPIMSRARTYEELEKITLEGINQFWSRNAINIGKGVHVGLDNYEVYINAKADTKGLSAPSIVYQTNCESGRSRNFEASRILYFYEGYLYYSDWKELNPKHPYYINKGWYYRSEIKTDEKMSNYRPLIEDYKMTSAHEIGHEILLAYGGHIYSKSHKGTTTGLNMIFQDVDKDAPNVPTSSEIDLMKYYQNYYDIPRTIITEFDLLKVIWLTKLKIQ